MVDSHSLTQPIAKKLIGEKAFSKISLYKALLEQQRENTIEYFASPFLRVNKISTRTCKLSSGYNFITFVTIWAGTIWSSALNPIPRLGVPTFLFLGGLHWELFVLEQLAQGFMKNCCPILNNCMTSTCVRNCLQKRNLFYLLHLRFSL